MHIALKAHQDRDAAGLVALQVVERVELDLGAEGTLGQPLRSRRRHEHLVAQMIGLQENIVRADFDELAADASYHLRKLRF